MNTPFAVAVLSSSIVSGTSLLYATLGELLGERAGIVNLGLEGTMLMGAATGFAICSVSGNPYLGIVAAAFAGMFANLLLGYVVISRRANQLASGFTLMLLGLGTSALIGSPFVGTVVDGLPRIALPGLGTYDLLVWLTVPTSLLLWCFLFRSRWGLALRAVGENPAAAFAAGQRPALLQYQALAVGGLLGGIGGAHLSDRPDDDLGRRHDGGAWIYRDRFGDLRQMEPALGGIGRAGFWRSRSLCSFSFRRAALMFRRS